MRRVKIEPYCMCVYDYVYVCECKRDRRGISCQCFRRARQLSGCLKLLCFQLFCLYISPEAPFLPSLSISLFRCLCLTASVSISFSLSCSLLDYGNATEAINLIDIHSYVRWFTADARISRVSVAKSRNSSGESLNLLHTHPRTLTHSETHSYRHTHTHTRTS